MDIRPTDFPTRPIAPTRETETKDPESSGGGSWAGGAGSQRGHHAEAEEDEQSSVLDIADIVDVSADYQAQHDAHQGTQPAPGDAPFDEGDEAAASDRSPAAESPPVRHLDIQA
jgi:hypothetical protein